MLNNRQIFSRYEGCCRPSVDLFDTCWSVIDVEGKVVVDFECGIVGNI